MPDPVAIECPACLATLKVPDDKLGKKIRCPKCSEIFVAEASEAAEDFDLEEERRPARGKGGVKKGGKKQSGSGLLIGGIVGGVALVAVAGVVIFLMSSGGDDAVPQAAQVAPVATPSPTAAPAGDPAAAMAASMGAHGAMPAGAAHGAPQSAPAATPVASPAIPPTTNGPAAAFVSQSSSGPAKLDLSWIPADSELIIDLRPAAIWAAPALQQALKHPMVFMAIGPMQAMTGIVPADIESLTVAMKLPDPRAAAAPTNGVAPSPGAEMPQIGNLQPVIVVRLKKPLLESVWERPDFPLETTEYAGQTVRKFSPPAADGKQLTFAFHQPNELAIVAGLDGTVQKLIDAKGDAKLFADWAPLDPNLQFQLAARPRDVKGLRSTSRSPLQPSISAEQKAFQDAMDQYLRSFSGGLRLTDGLQLSMRLQSDTPANTDALEAALRKNQETVNADFMSQMEAAFGGFGGPMPPELRGLLEALLANGQTSRDGAIISMGTSIPADKMELFAILAAKAQQSPMAGMMLGGMMPGGPAGMPPGGPGRRPTGERSGQTKPMATKTPGDLPPNLELQASTLWDAPQAGSASVPLLMQFRVTATDDAILCGAGEFEFRPPTTNSGASLSATSPRQTTLSAPEQLMRTYLVPLDPLENGAANVATFHLAFKEPDAKARSLVNCEGKFRIVRAKSQTDFQVPLKKPLTSKPELPDALSAAGLTVKLDRVKSDSGSIAEELVVSVGSSSLVARLQILDAESREPAIGWETPAIRYVSDRGGIVQRISSASGDPLPDRFLLSLVLFDGTESLTVPFSFADLPLPDPATRPVQALPPQFRGAPGPGGALPPGGLPGEPGSAGGVP